MKIIKYTNKFTLDPTDEQKTLLNKHFGSVRWTYNYFLNQRKTEYLNNKKSLNYYDQAAELTQIKKVNECLKEIMNGLIDHQVRLDLVKEFGGIRKTIVDYAFSSLEKDDV